MIRRILFAAAAIAAIGVTAAPETASARGFFAFSVGVPLFYAPPPVYYGPPPVYYGPPAGYYGAAPIGPYAPAPVARVLETVPTGTTATAAGQLTTPTRTWQSGQTWCREYTTSARIEGRQQQLVGTACRDPGGAWRIAS